MSESVKRIKLTVEEPAGISRTNWPVTQGVPFGRGELKQGSNIRIVTGDGTVLPAQGLTLATWGPESEYIRWLLVDFQVDLAAGETKELYLEYGQDV